MIGQNPDGNNGDSKCDHTQDNEEPSPPRNTVNAAQACEGGGTDKTGDCRCNDVRA
jgi:hypothetical protein